MSAPPNKTTVDARSYTRWRAILRQESLPCAVVDLDAVDRNLEIIRSALHHRPITLRVASKSVRHPWLLRYLLETGGKAFKGLMTFSTAEAEFLAGLGFQDMLMGYPVARRDEAQCLARVAEAGGRAIATVDDPEQVDLLSTAATESSTTIPVCIDIDASWRPLRGRLHFGVRRSPIRTAAAAVSLARHIADSPGVELTAVLAYEAQIAGIRERNPSSRHLDPARRFIKSRSRPAVAALRHNVREALHAEGYALQLVNGGGTGSIRWTGADPSVTEVTAGSGFLCPHLFDGYEGLSLEPAAFFALSIVRCPDDDFVTAAGGGYLASGPAAPDREPIVHAPEGLKTLAMEGWGEVQTPFKRGKEAPELGIGDPVVCRHAKAGELFERFGEVLFLRGEEIERREPSYRGMGRTFG